MYTRTDRVTVGFRYEDQIIVPRGEDMGVYLAWLTSAERDVWLRYVVDLFIAGFVLDTRRRERVLRAASRIVDEAFAAKQRILH